MPDNMKFLQSFPLFSELNDDELNRLEKIVDKRMYPMKQYLFMEGEPREAVYFIAHGAVKIFKVDEEGNEQVINLLQTGEMFPHIGFFESTPYPATAEVIDRAELWIIRNEDFDQFMMEHPAISLKVMKIMGQKISILQQRIQELISQDVLHRVVLTLIRLADATGNTQAKTVRIDMPMTNRDFANMIGTSRETINRVLNDLKKKGFLSMNRHNIMIHDLPRLKNITNRVEKNGHQKHS